MTKPKLGTPWQEALPDTLPRYIKRNIIPGPNDCWEWTRSQDDDGYGWASYRGKTHQAHRLVYILTVGQPPEDTVLDHTCRVRHCVNPAHLEPVTNRKNLERSELTPTGMTECLKCGSDFIWIGEKSPQRRCPVCLAAYREARKAEVARLARVRRATKHIRVTA